MRFPLLIAGALLCASIPVSAEECQFPMEDILDSIAAGDGQVLSYEPYDGVGGDHLLTYFGPIGLFYMRFKDQCSVEPGQRIDDAVDHTGEVAT